MASGDHSRGIQCLSVFDNIEARTQVLLNKLATVEKSLSDCKYSTTCFSDGVLSEMYRFYQQGEFCDFSIKVEDKVYQVHRLVMASSSDYFKAMLSHDMMETREESTDLRGITIRGVEPLLVYMYTGKLALTVENIQEVISAATFLQVMPAVDLCIEFLKENMTFDNAEELLNIAEVFSIPSLKEYYRNFILTNFLKFAESDAFLRMDADNLADYLMDDALITTSEAILLHHCLQWYNHDRDNREKDAFNVFEKVRMCSDGWPVICAAQKTEPFISNPDCVQLIADSEKYMSEAQKRYYNADYRSRVRSTRTTIIQFGGVTKFDEIYDSCPFDSIGGSNEMYGWEQNNFFHPDLKCWFPLGICRELGLRERYSNQKIVVVNESAIVIGGYEYTISTSESSLSDASVAKTAVKDVKMFTAQGTFQAWDMVKLQHARARHAAVYLPGYIYVIGGKDDRQSLTSVERLDCEKETWSYVKALPRVLYDHTAVAINGKILVAGGVEKYTVVKKVWCYDPAENKWRKRAQLNCARAGHGMVVHGGHVYVAGGYNSTSALLAHARCLVSVERYDMAADQWTKVATLKHDCAHIDMLVFNEKILMLGGVDSDGQLSTYIYEYDPSLDRWKLFGELPRPLKSVACCAIKVKLTATGCMEDETDEIAEEYERIFNEETREERQVAYQRNTLRMMENFDPGDYLLDEEDLDYCC